MRVPRLKYDPFVDGTPPKPAPKVVTLPQRRRIDPFAPAEPEPVKPKQIAVKTPEREGLYRAALFDTESLSADALLVGVAIGHHYFSSWELYASQKTIAKLAHIPESSLKRVRNALKELEEAGFLQELERLPDRRVKYRITVPVVRA